MSKWDSVEIIFKLKSPLHIGYMPFKGSVVSPTRYYVPGRALWGAVTKRITEKLHNRPAAQDYERIGRQVMENFRFSYFYLFDGKTVYYPEYTEEGLEYGDISEAEFEERFIGSTMSTAIESEDGKGSAKFGSLHEIVYVNNRYRDEEGAVREVKIKGFALVREGAEIEGKKVILGEDKGIFANAIQELILGGESKYGFGHVLLDTIRKDCNLPIKIDGDGRVEIEENKPLIAHLKYAKSLGFGFEGNIELLVGRGYFDPENPQDPKNSVKHPGGVVSKPRYYLSPGTKITCKITAEMHWDGTLAPI